jgi:chromosome segregation ATPase
MGTEFLPPEEFRSLPESWFKLVESVEALKEHRSASESLESSLAELSVLAAETKRYLDLVCTSAMRLVPERRDFFDGAMQKIGSAIEKFSQAVEDDVEKLRLYLELAEEIGLKDRKLGIQKGHRQELELQVQRACDKAEKLRDAYEKKVGEIRAQTDERLAEIRDIFLIEARRLLRGCRVYSDAGDELPLEVLFEHLIKDPSYHERIRITGLVLNKDPLRHAIKELADEGARKIPPLLEEERRKLAKLEEEKRKVERASSTCEGLREELKETIEKERELEKSLEELRKRAETLGERFNSYSGILSLREDYLSILNSATEARKRLFLALEEDFRDFLPEEKDAEKRELREELRKRIAELEDKSSLISSLKERNSELERKLSELEKEYEESRQRESEKVEIFKEENIKLSKEVENLRAKLEQAERRIKETEKKIKSAEKLEKELALLEEEKSALSSEIKNLKIESKKMHKKLEKLEKEKLALAEEMHRLKEEIKRERDLRKAVEIEKSKVEGVLKEGESEKAKLEKTIAAINAKLKEKDEEINGLKSQIEKLLKEKGVKEKELDRLKRMIEENERLERELKDKKEEIDSLKARIEEVLAEKLTLEENIKKELINERSLRIDAEKKLKDLKAELSKEKEAKSELERRYAEVCEEAELLRMEVERLKRLLKRRSQAKPMKTGRDEAYVGEKIDALRRRK